MIVNVAAQRSRVEPAEDVGHWVSFREALLVWIRVAALSFGGPSGQIAAMHCILFEDKRWIGETGSCRRSITACCCPRRNPISLRSISDGFSTGRGEVLSPGRYLFCRGCYA